MNYPTISIIRFWQKTLRPKRSSQLPNSPNPTPIIYPLSPGGHFESPPQISNVINIISIRIKHTIVIIAAFSVLTGSSLVDKQES